MSKLMNTPMSLNIVGHGLGLKQKSRVGRGPGSGSGKTAGRGHKGQKSRSGVSIKGFEGGQMPLLRRIPKRGFHNNFSKKYCIINFAKIEGLARKGLIKKNDKIDLKKLTELGIVKGKNVSLKLIDNGKVSMPFFFEVAKSSPGAKKAVEAAGGQVSIISD